MVGIELQLRVCFQSLIQGLLYKGDDFQEFNQVEVFVSWDIFLQIVYFLGAIICG